MIPPACARCDSVNRPAARFCDTCGADLRSSVAPVATVATPKPSPGLTDDELKSVTVLFGDIVGSTAQIAGQEPEDARQRLTPAITAMSAAVQAFGGTVNQMLGDGIMALFGVPLSQEDHAVRACCAALRMHELANALDPPAKLRVGLATGTTLLSATANEAAGAFFAFGETVHLASRLQGLAPAGATVCSSETMNLAGGAVTAVPLGVRALRGLPSGQVFRLTGLRRSGLRFSRTVARGLSPYVNRVAELAALHRWADIARGGTAASVAVLGEAGGGKSRLVWEFSRALEADGWTALRAEAVSYGRNIPYLLLTALVRSCLMIGDLGSVTAATRLVNRGLGTLGCNSPLIRCALLSLLDIPLDGDTREWDGLDPVRRRDALRDSVSALLRAFAMRGPLMIVIEDLHWADEQSARLIDQAAASVPGLLQVMTYRHGHQPHRAAPPSAEIVLAPLAAADMARLVHEGFDGRFDPALQQQLVARAGGNPFFLEEMARAAAEAADLPSRGTATEREAVPSTVQAVLAERIDRLASEDRQVLRAASALGTRFSFNTLQALFSARPAAEFRQQLGRLQDAGLLSPVRPTPSDLGFAHALIQEVAYEGLPRGRRRHLHARIVEAVKEVNAGRTIEQAETLTYHASRAEAWVEITVHAQHAGRRAAARSAYRDAAVFFEQAIDAFERLPPSRDTLAQCIRLRLELRNALFPTSRIGDSLRNSQECTRLAERLADPDLLGWAMAFLARDLTLTGRPTEALAVTARSVASAGDNDELAVVTRSYAALAAYSLGDYAQSAAIFRTLLEQVEAGDRMRRYGYPGPAAVYFRCWLAWALSRTGESAEALEAVEGMMALAEESDQPLILTVALLGKGFVLAYAGRLDDAAAALRASLDLCRRWEFFAWFTNIASCLGEVLSRAGEHEEAVALLEQAVAQTKASGILVSHASELAWLAEAHLRAGRPDSAIHVCADAIDVAQTHEERGNEAYATCVMAEAMRQRGCAVAEVTARFRTALGLAERCGMGPLVRRCQAGLATAGSCVEA
ncbi:MAG: AAA family ATPase [Gemmatimonadaceae bacterium]|nr:AAA family ATPase [Acetobacteraceae bacterium]